MFKKVLCTALALLMCVSCVAALSACSDDSDFKVGFICLHDENSTYDKNFLEGAKAACEAAGLEEDQIIYKKNIPESNDCYIAAKDLVDQGCDVIFANSFGHEDYIIQAAKEFPDVQFCHATGTKAHTEENLPNYQNVFASIYEGRYLAGIAAGMKLNAMIEAGEITAEQAKMGYVGAFTYAEVISGYTSFYLGAKSVCPSVTMEVTFTGEWYDEAKEKTAAADPIALRGVLLSYHAASMGAHTACETKGVPNISYNGSTLSACPNTFIVSSRINWEPYFTYMIEQAKKGEDIATDWTGSIATGSVVLTDVNDKVAAAGTADAIADAKAKLQAGTLHVFDAANFTVTVVTEGNNTKNVNATVDGNGKLTSYKADVDTDAAFAGDTEVVNANGIFEESKYRSAPYFDLQIDGITLLDVAF